MSEEAFFFSGDSSHLKPFSRNRLTRENMFISVCSWEIAKE
jgi:hypothetical protein